MEKEFILDGKMFKSLVSTVTQIPCMDENRFGLSLQHAKDFIQAYKNQQIHGYKVCTMYQMEWKSASVHAESFSWNILEYKASYMTQNICFDISLIGDPISQKINSVQILLAHQT